MGSFAAYVATETDHTCGGRAVGAAAPTLQEGAQGAGTEVELAGDSGAAAAYVL